MSNFKSMLGCLIWGAVLSSCASQHWVACDPTALPLTSINIIDRNGMSETINSTERLEQYSTVDFLEPQPYQKVLRVYNRDQQGNIFSCITSYHSNGYPSQYLEVVNSRAFGAYREWYSNGMKKIDARVVGGVADIVEGSERTWLFDGCCQVWDESGRLQTSIPYASGELEGVALYYHTNENRWKSIPYHKNKIHGMMEIFQENGVILQSCCYQNGLKHGKLVRYWDESALAAEEEYCESFLVTGRYYNTQGENIAQIEEGKGIKVVFSKDGIAEFHEFRNGVLDGEVKVFDRYGRIAKLYHMKNDVKQGEEMTFFDASRFQQTLTPKISMTWYEGKMQGPVKTWYESGQQESQKEMNNNKKHGHGMVWYDDGGLMMIEEYNQNKLVKGEYYAKGENHRTVSEVFEGTGTATIFGADGTLQRKVKYLNGKPALDE